MENFEKVCRLGVGTERIRGRFPDVFVTIKYKDGRLSFTGVEGPLKNGDALGGCGQIVDRIHPDEFREIAEGWSRLTILSLRAVWKRWHLNDMRPGTPKQMEEIRRKSKEVGKPASYEIACQWLKDAELYNDDGYKYGSAWLKEEVPENVLKWLIERPNSDKLPAWH